MQGEVESTEDFKFSCNTHGRLERSTSLNADLAHSGGNKGAAVKVLSPLTAAFLLLFACIANAQKEAISTDIILREWNEMRGFVINI